MNRFYMVFHESWLCVSFQGWYSFPSSFMDFGSGLLTVGSFNTPLYNMRMNVGKDTQH